MGSVSIKMGRHPFAASGPVPLCVYMYVCMLGTCKIFEKKRHDAPTKTDRLLRDYIPECL